MNIDLECAKSRQTLILRAQGRDANAVADLTMGLIIAINRRILDNHLSVKRRYWPVLSPNELPHDFSELTWGLFGIGQMVREIAKRAKAFGMKISACDPYVQQKEFDYASVLNVNLADLLKNSDVYLYM